MNREDIEQIRLELMTVRHNINQLKGKLGGLTAYQNKLQDQLMWAELNKRQGVKLV